MTREDDPRMISQSRARIADERRRALAAVVEFVEGAKAGDVHRMERSFDALGTGRTWGAAGGEHCLVSPACRQFRRRPVEISSLPGCAMASISGRQPAMTWHWHPPCETCYPGMRALPFDSTEATACGTGADAAMGFLGRLTGRWRNPSPSAYGGRMKAEACFSRQSRQLRLLSALQTSTEKQNT